MSILALLVLMAAFVCCFVDRAPRWLVPGLIALGVAVALLLSSGPAVTTH